MTTPDWLKNAPPPVDTRWKPGRSANPAGRPKGIVDKRSRVAAAFMDDAENIAKKVVAAALEGDLQAANIVLARLAPPLKARAEKVSFTLNKDAPLVEQASSILLAVSLGQIDPETGKLLIDCLKAFADLKVVDELEEKINAAVNAAIEGRQRSAARGGVLALASAEGRLIE
jgi:Family of unknown function (DUF5681)